MSDLLTHEEYKAIAADLSLPVNAFINGKFTAPKSGNTMDSLNPATGALLGKVAACDTGDVDHAVTKAREAFDRGEWSRLHPSERKRVMIQLGKFVAMTLDELAELNHDLFALARVQS